MKILHFSDTHLGAKRYGLNESYNDFNKAFDEVIKYIDELKPDIVIHSGDLFDKSKPTPLTLREAFSKIIKVSKQVPFLIIPGNHDFSVSIGISPISLLSIDNDKIKVTEQRDIFENGRINVEKIKFQFDGINFFLIPYFHNSGVLRNCIDQILDSLNPNEINLLVLHQIVSQEVLRRKNKVFSNVDIPFENLESFDFVFLGHFHSPLFLNNKFAYAGSTEALSYDEYDYDKNGFIKEQSKKRIFVYEVKSKNEIKKIDRITLKSPRKFIKLEFKDPTEEEIRSELKNHQDKEAILVLKIENVKKDVIISLRQIKNAFNDYFHYIHIDHKIIEEPIKINQSGNISSDEEIEKQILGEYYEDIIKIYNEVEKVDDDKEKKEKIEELLRRLRDDNK